MGDMDSQGRQSKGSGGDPPAQHVLLIPQGTVSHGIPLLKVATLLASHGIKVSFVAYVDEIPGMSFHLPSAEEHPQHARNFRFLEVPRPSIPASQFHELEFQDVLQPSIEKFAQDKENGAPGGPTCLLVDMFEPWTEEISALLKIPRYVLITSGVIFGKFLLEYVCNYDRGVYKIQNGSMSPFEGYVTDPGLPSLTYADIPNRSRKFADHTVICSRALWTSTGVLFNSFAELEQDVLDAWKLSRQNSLAEHTKVPATYVVGPLLATSATKYVPSGLGLEDSGETAYQWLISQPASSVLYVAFGTRHGLSSQQIKGLALGLEASEQRFLWVNPKQTPTSDGEPVQDGLPEGFRERVHGRGCVVDGWVSQVQILSHSSTAGFLTHCGWNSVLESILNGVPLIAWPQLAEQRLNCRYLVDTLRIAIEMQTTGENLASQDHVKDSVRQLLMEPAGEKVKARMKEFQKKAQLATSEGGSQSSSTQKLIQDIRSGFANH